MELRDGCEVSREDVINAGWSKDMYGLLAGRHHWESWISLIKNY